MHRPSVFAGRIFGLLLSMTTACAATATWAEEDPKDGFSGGFFADGGKYSSSRLPLTGTTESAAILCDFPGAYRLYFEPERKTFRPGKKDFQAGTLTLEARFDGGGELSGAIFLQTKDGLWFQSVEEIHLPGDGKYHQWSLRLDERGRIFRGIGHNAVWGSVECSRIFAVGLSVYSAQKVSGKLEMRKPRRSGKRQYPPLAVEDWICPPAGTARQVLESRFQLSRDYFNVFDPKEIRIDYEVMFPDGKTVRKYPAFFTRNGSRNLHFTCEEIRPEGQGYWAFRFYPPHEGKYRFRLRIADAMEKSELLTGWRECQMERSSHSGAVRISRRNPRFFELENGQFFFPIGLNLHTNTDVRSELRFRLGFRPDRGTYDYDDYLAWCGKSKINVVEIWMAAWTMALEHDSARTGYYGVGRYHLENAWKLDHVLEIAAKKGIFVNLVLDNHGRLSSKSDPEWRENPFNCGGDFSVANGAFLKTAPEYFTDARAWDAQCARMRYIAARWGMLPQVMTLELWSEVDLVDDFNTLYENGTMEKWTARCVQKLREWCRPGMLFSSHVCGDYKKVLKYPKIFEIPEITHVSCDAYRDEKIPIADHLNDFGKAMNFEKPQWITEYGGSSAGSKPSGLLADLHAGLWSSLFARLAGAPMLWWHDPVIMNGERTRPHYTGFAAFLRGLDLRGKELTYPELSLLDRNGKRPMTAFGARVGILRDRAFGWVFQQESMLRYEEDSIAARPEENDLLVIFSVPWKEVFCRAEFFDSLTGKLRERYWVKSSPDGRIRLLIPPFRSDCGFKLYPEKRPKK